MQNTVHIVGLGNETVRYGQTIGDLMDSIRHRVRMEVEAEVEVEAEAEAGPVDFELVNPHGKVLPRNLPIRGDMTLKLMLSKT